MSEVSPLARLVRRERSRVPWAKRALQASMSSVAGSSFHKANGGLGRPLARQIRHEKHAPPLREGLETTPDSHLLLACAALRLPARDEDLQEHAEAPPDGLGSAARGLARKGEVPRSEQESQDGFALLQRRQKAPPFAPRPWSMR